jgi:uncharacterized cofD-like protein
VKTVTVIGGGTGSFNVLKGLRLYGDLQIRSIVTMMDSGGDSGRLRDEFGVLPPGDIRRCLVALSEESELMRDLFSFRFGDGPLEDRQFGNLFFIALTQILGSQKEAIEAIGGILKIRGRVIAVTWDDAHIYAELENGALVQGEANIDVPRHDTSVPIRRVYLNPPAQANPEAVAAIAESDYVIFAPGNLFTSTIPNLLVDGIPAALQRSRARIVYVVNLMTRHGETDGYSAADHVAQIARYAGRVPDAVVVHRGDVPAEALARYEAERSYRVPVDPDRLRAIGVKAVHGGNVMSTSSVVRHDPALTAACLVELFDELEHGQPLALPLRGRGRSRRDAGGAS